MVSAARLVQGRRAWAVGLGGRRWVVDETPSLTAVLYRRGARTPIRGARDAIAAHAAEVVVVGGLDGAEAPPSQWPRAINRALESARGPLVLLLHCDVVVGPAAVASMARRLRDDASIGAVGPVLIGERGERRRCFGRFYWPDWLPGRGAQRVPLLSAACLMTRVDVLRELGGLREDLLMPANEEYEWCARLARAGYRLERLPERVLCRARDPEPVDPLIDLQRGFLYLAQTLRERPTRAPRPHTDTDDADEEARRISDPPASRAC